MHFPSQDALCILWIIFASQVSDSYTRIYRVFEIWVFELDTWLAKMIVDEIDPVVVEMYFQYRYSVFCIHCFKLPLEKFEQKVSYVFSFIISP